MNKKRIIIIPIILILIIVLVGSLFLINKINYDKKIKKIENELNKNLKIINENNKKISDLLEEEEKEFNNSIEEISNNEDKMAEEVKKLKIVGIGDSVFEDALNEIKSLLPNGYYDAKISRPLITGNEILLNLKNSNRLTDIIVLGLANNGFYSEKNSKRLMEIVGDRTVYWLNSVGPDDPNYNRQFKEFAENYDNLHIIDWESASTGHPEYFYRDGTHLKPDGLKAYARLIYNTLYNDYKETIDKKIEDMKKEHMEEKNNKFTFYGSDVLISIGDKLNEKYDKTIINAKKDYKFDDLYKDLKEKIDNNSLEKKIVFIFDKEANISLKEYKKLIDLCKDYEIYICDISKKLNFDNDNVKVIDFYNDIESNKDYLKFDNKHLTNKGIKALLEKVYSSIENKEV